MAEYYKESEEDKCPVKWVMGKNMEFYAGCLRGNEDEWEGEAGQWLTDILVSKNYCGDCPYRSTMWVKKDGTITIRCKAKEMIGDE